MAQNKGNYEGVINGADPRQLRWAPSVRAMWPRCRIMEFVIWAQEDLAFTWPEVMRRMAGVGPDVPLLGEDAVLADLLSPEILHDLRGQYRRRADLTIRGLRNLVRTGPCCRQRGDGDGKRCGIARLVAGPD